MKNILHLLLFSACALLAAVQCSTRHTPDRLPAQQLRFGSGGGFSGEVTTWTLLSNGQLFITRGLKGDMVEWKQHARREGRKLFLEAEALKLLEKPAFSHPGNVYRFIEWTNGERTQRFTWGSREHAVDSVVEAFYGRLMALTRDQ
ncbi:MAG: hypothetical protein RMJ33_13930 [Saprospiraceae bacterium]|nr:hypothetical protein [Saprospiraceae bacterium]MDW8230928.1 hypothetical protein [Saprospiraceae bacterium]